MFASNKSARYIVFMLVILALAFNMLACEGSGGEGGTVEQVVSDSVSNGIDTATGNNDSTAAQGICYNRDGIVAIEIPCP